MLDSISRVANDVCDQHHIAARQSVLQLIAAYADVEELINIGAYARGSNPTCDVAISMKQAIDAFLQQSTSEKAAYPHTCRSLLELAAAAQQEFSQRAARANAQGASPPPPSRKS